MSFSSQSWQKSLDRFTCSRCKQTSSCVLKMCSRCKSVVYCGSNCQREDWSDHKSTCAQLRKEKRETPIKVVGYITPEPEMAPMKRTLDLARVNVVVINNCKNGPTDNRLKTIKTMKANEEFFVLGLPKGPAYVLPCEGNCGSECTYKLPRNWDKRLQL